MPRGALATALPLVAALVCACATNNEESKGPDSDSGAAARALVVPVSGARVAFAA